MDEREVEGTAGSGAGRGQQHFALGLGSALLGMAWHGMAQHGTTQTSVVQHGTASHSMTA